MSYILDALRRADAERERGAVPGLHAQPLSGTPLPAGGRRPGWPALLALAGGLVIAGLAAAVWMLWQRGPVQAAAGAAVAGRAGAPTPAASVAAASPTAGSTAALPAVTPAASATASPPLARAPERVPAPAAADPMADPSAPVARTQHRTLPAAPRPADPPYVAPARRQDPSPSRTAPEADRAVADTPTAAAPAAANGPAAPPAGSTAGTAAERRIYAVDELPAEIRGSLPPLAISGSIYSDDPASRFLMVNGEVVREGGRLGPDVVLEQIQPKSAVLRYKGYRYRVRF